MSNIEHVVFDMDDVLCNTSEFILKQLFNHYRLNNDQVKLSKLGEYIVKNVSPFLFSEEFRDDIWNFAVKDGFFALYANPSPIFNNELLDFFESSSQNGIRLHICTHRGYMEKDKGSDYTCHWLKTLGIIEYFDNIFVIKSKDHPNKLTFLDEELGTENYRLVDDNPLHDVNKLHPKNEKLIIYNGINILPGYRENLVTEDPITVLKSQLS